MSIQLYVSPQWLVEHQNDSAYPLRIVDCRFLLSDPSAGEKAYESGHIEGAVYLRLGAGFVCSYTGGPEGRAASIAGAGCTCCSSGASWHQQRHACGCLR